MKPRVISSPSPDFPPSVQRKGGSITDMIKQDANLRLAQIFVARQEITKAISLNKEARRLKPRDSVGRYQDQLRLIARSRG